MFKQKQSTIALAELIFYGPVLGISTFLWYRHRGVAPWFLLFFFAVLRIFPSSFQLATEPLQASSRSRTQERGLYTDEAICLSLDLGLLILIWLGLVQRIFKAVFKHRLLDLLPVATHGLILLGLALNVAGVQKIRSAIQLVNRQPDGSRILQGHSSAKAGVCIYAFVWFAALCLFTYYVGRARRHLLETEGLMTYAALISVPFFLARVVYAILVVFDYDWTNHTLIDDGRIAERIAMSVVMEMCLIIIFFVAGFFSLTVTKARRPFRSRLWPLTS